MRSALKNQKLAVHIRWMINRDLAEVEQIEQEHDGAGRDRRILSHLIRNMSARIMVAEAPSREVIGHIIYRAMPGYWLLWDVLVHPKYRRCGVGSQLLEHLTNRTSARGSKRSRVEFNSSDNRTNQHLFLRSCRFRAVGINVNDHADDEYCFVWREDYLG